MTEGPVVAVVPARGGSRRIPRKNVRIFCGRPMIEWSLAAARASGCFDRIVVSTDDEEIAQVARGAGAEVPFRRAEALADEHTGAQAVLVDAIERLALPPGAVVCCLYATAPLLRPEDLRLGLQRLRASGADFALAVTTFPFPIQRALRVDAADRLGMFEPEHLATRSQDLEEAWHDAGQFCFGRARAWTDAVPVFSPAAVAVPMPRHRVQDIDTEEDWLRAEAMCLALRRTSETGA